MGKFLRIAASGTFLLAFTTLDASAICNVIPAATTDFRAALGSTNRPFASPEDYVEVRVRSEICDGSSAGYVDVDADGSMSDDHVVLVLFVPPQGAANAAILAEDCAGVDVAACAAQLGGGTATCTAVNGGGPPGIVVPSQRELQFRFPDTDDRVGSASDDHTLAGPAKLVVSRTGFPLRCELASARCADLAGDTSTNGVVACVDELYALDGTCRTGAADVDGVFGHFTALPPPSNFEAMVDQPALTEMRFTTDAAGNVLLPMDYTGKLVRVGSVPVPLLGRAATSVDAFVSAPGAPISLPGDGFVDSYSPEGVVLPPVFTPIRDPSNPSAATLFGSMDAPRGVIRMARRGCVGGDDEGRTCSAGPDCSSGTCSTALFDFADRYEAGVGPVVVAGGPSGEYTAQVEDPVPLQGLAQNEEIFSFTISEAVDGIDRNGDGDLTDFVVTLRDRDSGVPVPIGPGPTPGLAGVRVRVPPFAHPAVETEGDLLVFLESEAQQGYADLSGNGRVFETLLRVFRLGVGEIGAGSPIVADAEPLVEGRSVAVSQNRIYFRTAEPSVGTQMLGTVVGNAASAFPNLSADGRWLAYFSLASNLVAFDTNGDPDHFVGDLQSGGVTRVHVTSAGGQVFGNCAFNDRPDISPDGRFVVYASCAAGLVGGDTNSANDVFLHDRDVDADGIYDEAGQISTTRVSLDSLGGQANGPSFAATLSADGTRIVFNSSATNLVAGDTNGTNDVFLHDTTTGATTRIDVDSMGQESDGFSFFNIIDDAGRFVAIQSLATNLVPGDTNGASDVFLRDTTLGTTSAVTLPPGESGDQADLSSDAGRVVFHSGGAFLSDDTNGRLDIYTYDRVEQLYTRVSLDSAGAQANGHNWNPNLSPDGRYVGFHSDATNLVPGDTNGVGDVFLHDLRTGSTTRVGPVSSPPPTTVGHIAVSRGGAVVAFATPDALDAGDFNGVEDVYVAASMFTSGDLSGDGLPADDTVLRVFDVSTGASGTLSTLCPAEQVEVAAGRAAFLRPESAGSTGAAKCTGGPLTGPDLNLDGDELDEVVFVYDGVLDVLANLRCPASRIDLSSTRLAALVIEDLVDLNGDGDSNGDTVLQVIAPTSGSLASCTAPGWTNTGQTGDAVQVSGDVVALVTPEAEHAGTDLNGDGDAVDRVIRLLDGSTGSLIPILDALGMPDSPQAAEEFVLGAALVAFRTSEAAQGNTDLNGDGDVLDGVLQVYDLATGERINTGQAVTPCRLLACDPRTPWRVNGGTVRFLTLESEQGADLNDDGDQTDLLVQVFNVASKQPRVVAEVADTGATLENPVNAADPLAPAPTSGPADGAHVVVGRGRCVEDSTVSCTVGAGSCPAGEFCFSAAGPTGTCVRDTGRSCFPDKPAGEQGCLPAASCVGDFVVLGVSDTDADEVPDSVDNCPLAANLSQADADLDGVGDACDLETCGNSLVEIDEECDDGNLTSGDGCDANCRITACGNGIVTVGEACDDGNQLDQDGCSSACVREECRDGEDNDGDGDVDFPADPGCADADQPREFTGCDDDVDNDADGTIDWDGGSGGGTADAFCNGNPNKKREKPSCGLGLELALLLAAAPRLRRRRRR